MDAKIRAHDEESLNVTDDWGKCKGIIRVGRQPNMQNPKQHLDSKKVKILCQVQDLVKLIFRDMVWISHIYL